MSASELERAEWLDSPFWDRLDRLESRHRQVLSAHERAQREFERFSTLEPGELRAAWERYCEVIAELDRATADIESLRMCAL
ncbi:MAG TPA: hypothetical protein VMU44_10715 [Steroidobacteraceae bacterium]|nr:hypothetical protein [Steroidobacteraceae bacterium]